MAEELRTNHFEIGSKTKLPASLRSYVVGDVTDETSEHKVRCVALEGLNQDFFPAGELARLDGGT
eukprot:CAMPEP_0194043970 /NCGR_PEP_ID=MMETSP0009_2-20130614/15528_1 /TAXON_ID=210454 /ORGANISM="Grammatophora oceanica, Strain CCMP 410" /LENGTH=64 /DNA_ID=CAMNT_0038688371 /DNA_START=1592 /DNA_END=1786 /DNA_ORIENTATION=+